MSFFYRSLAPSLFRSILWHTNDLTVHLTFDDGPHPKATPKALEILKSRQIKATFFLLGDNVERFPDLAREIYKQGHTIGNHGLTHMSLLLKSLSWQSHQIEQSSRIIRQTIGNAPRLFRPPFGRFGFATIKAATALGLKTVMWDVDAKDFSTSGTHAIIRRVCRQTVPGSIVLLHDNESTSGTLQEYLNPILDFLEERNLKFSPLGL
jgi:peptidoglycan/xylan/chitin deacetylase (PgdA/CDA1 family)